MFNVDLDTLARIKHLFVGLRDVLGVRRFNRRKRKSFKEPVKTGDRSCIAARPELDPKDDKAYVRVAAPHVPDQLDLIGSMLIRVMMRASGMVSERIPGAVITVLPAIDVLPVCFVPSGSVGYTMFFSVTNEG